MTIRWLNHTRNKAKSSSKRKEPGVSLVRDSFEPSELLPGQRTCSSCGGLSKRGRLFRYGIHVDGTSIEHIIWHAGYYCGIECYILRRC